MNTYPYQLVTLLSLTVLFTSTCKTTSPSIKHKPLQAKAPRIKNTQTKNISKGTAIISAQRLISLSLDELATSLPVSRTSLPKDLSYKEILNPDRTYTSSLSLGSVGKGILINATQLSHSGPHHEIISRHRKNKTNFGTQELVDLIRDGATHVGTTLGGAKLRIGNLSHEKGGDIRWSRSHNSGRDADLAFYMLNEKGISVEAPALARCLPDGSFPRFPGYQFDVKRNWALVASMIEHKVDLQWIFISNPLKEKLLLFAETTDASDALIRKASFILHQPTDARSHDDHFHIRITCPLKNRLEGCLPTGPSWDWLPNTRPFQLARTIELGKALQSSDAKTRHAALIFLTKTKFIFRADLALSQLSKVPLPMQTELMRLAASPYSWSEYALNKTHRLIPKLENLLVLKDAYKILRRSQDTESYAFLIDRAGNTALKNEERQLAIRSLRHSEDGKHISFLMNLFAEKNAALNPTIHEQLQYLTNHRGVFEKWPNDKEEENLALSYWKNLYTAFGEEPNAWKEDGFRDAGIHHINDIDMLIASLETAPLYLAYSINRRLRTLTGRWSPLEFSNASIMYLRWKKWWARNHPRSTKVATR